MVLNEKSQKTSEENFIRRTAAYKNEFLTTSPAGRCFPSVFPSVFAQIWSDFLAWPSLFPDAAMRRVRRAGQSEIV
jgi:hypothetical protein